MERVAFLIEETGERIGCMLNPEGLVVRRVAGVRRAISINGQLSGSGMNDDPLLYTGGGYTEVQLDLLFDVTLAGSSIQTEDVRDLTGPLWRLAENARKDSGYGRPPLARFVWGKAWNVLGIVTSVAERFDRFTSSGEPQRSWLRMRFVRVDEPETDLTEEAAMRGESSRSSKALATALESLPEEVPLEEAENPEVDAHELHGDGIQGENLPELSYRYYGDPTLWRWLAWFNRVIHPLKMAIGSVLRIPPLQLLRKRL